MKCTAVETIIWQLVVGYPLKFATLTGLLWFFWPAQPFLDLEQATLISQ